MQIASDAAAVLRHTKGVDPRRVGAVGWSMGGGVVLADAQGRPADRPFAAVAGFSTRGRDVNAAQMSTRSHIPLQIWWSKRDRIVVDQAGQSGLLYRAIKRLAPRAPVVQIVGTWRHSAEMRANRQLPVVLARLGLVRLAPHAMR